MSALSRMIRAGRADGRILDDALDGLGEVFGDPETAWQVGRQFTCAEADRIAWVLIASRRDDAAIVWLNGHAAGDTDGLHGGDRFDARRYIERLSAEFVLLVKADVVIAIVQQGLRDLDATPPAPPEAVEQVARHG